MKSLLLFSGLAAAVVTSAWAVEEGDSYRQVVEEKGVPISKMEAGGLLILKYSDSVIKLRDGKVISNTPATEGATVSANGKAAQRPVSPVGIGQWTTDYTAGLRQAQADKRLVFVFFTGSDWCGWCKRLDREILSTSEFKGFAADKLVLVKIDFPRSRPLPVAQQANNQKLAERYSVDGFPTVVVLNSAGKEVGRLGYQEGGPAPFIKALKKF